MTERVGFRTKYRLFWGRGSGTGKTENENIGAGGWYSGKRLKAAIPLDRKMSVREGSTFFEIAMWLGVLLLTASVTVSVGKNLLAKSKAKEAETALVLLKASQEEYHAIRLRYATNFEELGIPGFELRGRSGTVARYRTYTVKLFSDSRTYQAEAVGYPLDEEKADIWSIDHTMEKPRHQIYGY